MGWRRGLVLLLASQHAMIVTAKAAPSGVRSKGGDVTQPRAADDFSAIRSRMLELRREREQASAQVESGFVPGPSPKPRALRPEADDQRRLPRPAVRRGLG